MLSNRHTDTDPTTIPSLALRMRAEGKNGRLYAWPYNGVECWISATEWFQRKPHKAFDLRCPLST